MPADKIDSAIPTLFLSFFVSLPRQIISSQQLVYFPAHVSPWGIFPVLLLEICQGISMARTREGGSTSQYEYVDFITSLPRVAQ